MSSFVSYQASRDVPDAVVPIAEAMSSFPAPWAICGGWAVDAWLGSTTREHGDVDVSVFVQDQRRLFEHLPGWQILAHDPSWTPGGPDAWWDGRRPLGPTTHLHVRPPEFRGPMPANGIATDEDGFSLEFYLDDRSGDDWVLCREPLITLPIRHAVAESPWGVPAAAPQVLLFFKSRDLRRRDKLDFARLLPHLSGEQRDWLREAVSRLGHPWLSELGRKA